MEYKKNKISWQFTYHFLLGLMLFSFFQCASSNPEKVSVIKEEIQIEEVVIIPPPPVTYHLVSTKDSMDWLKSLKAGDTLSALMYVNRIDGWRLKHLDTLVFPDSIGTGTGMYSPFPANVDELQSINKIMFVSYYAQAFAVYEKGERIKWGPVSMGKKYTPTPIGLFATNWKSKRTTSTVNPSWILDWYFNLHNHEGIGMHQYALPGYPGSHGCVRLFKDDANWLYHWADQWVIENSKVAVHGTPVLIFGEYPYDEGKPWLKLTEDMTAIEITPDILSAEMEEFLPTIMERQAKRDSVELVRLSLVSETTK